MELTTLPQLLAQARRAADLTLQVAQAAESEIEALDGGKQDKLTGAAGQVVGFDGTGRAVAQTYAEADPTVPAWAKAASKPAYTAAEVGAVPTARKVNNRALSADITLTASDVGAVPTSRKVNNKALSADIALTASDVGAVPAAGGAMTGPLSTSSYIQIGGMKVSWNAGTKSLDFEVV